MDHLCQFAAKIGGFVFKIPWPLFDLNCVPRLSSVLDPAGRPGGLGEKVGSACEEFEG